MKLVFVSPSYGAQENYQNLLGSVQSQNDERYHHVVVDDMSTGDSFEKLQKLQSRNNSQTFVKNEERKYALRNVIEQSRKFQDDEDIVIGILDGDDQLCNDDTVSLILDEYENGKDIVWTGHRWDVNGQNISRDMPPHVDPYQWPWSTSHLKTFRASLLKGISDRNFQDHTGTWFKRGYDQALYLPLLYKTQARKYISNICYQYNINSVSMPVRNPAEVDQIRTVNFVRARGFCE